MCMGCAQTILLNSDGKTTDSAEAALYVTGLALWVLLLTHLKKKNAAKELTVSSPTNGALQKS